VKALALLLLLAGCGPPRGVHFGTALPSYQARDYDRVHKRWTRYAHVRHLFDVALNAGVTLAAPDFRAAHAAKIGATRRLTAGERDALIARELLDAEQFVDFYVVAETGNWAWNDFSSPRSLWSITLVDDRGREAGRPEVQPLGLKREILEDLFYPVTPFTRGWRVRFPKQLADGSRLADPGTRWVRLRIAGPLGAEELRWEAD
jgi:hypothetical protein